MKHEFKVGDHAEWNSEGYVRGKDHERWLTLFAETVDENFAGPKSEEAKSRAMCIADTFARRMGVLTDPAALARTLHDECHRAP